MRPVRYLEAAEEELLNEIGYLELRTIGLGRRFYAEVRRAEDRIAEFSESGVELGPGVRGANLRKFRYGLIYSIESDFLLVLAVAHHSRRPGYWVGREKPHHP